MPEHVRFIGGREVSYVIVTLNAQAAFGTPCAAVYKGALILLRAAKEVRSSDGNPAWLAAVEAKKVVAASSACKACNILYGR